MPEKVLRSTLTRRYGHYFVLVFFIWLALRMLQIPTMIINLWRDVFFWALVLLFRFDTAWIGWLKQGSTQFVVFPERMDSANRTRPVQALDVDPEGKVPAYASVLSGGTNQTLVLRDKNISIVPRSAIEIFGKDGYALLVHSPEIPVPSVDALLGFFGDSLPMVQEVSFVGRRGSKGFFSLLNSLAGENNPVNLQTQAKIAAELESVKKARGVITSAEESLIDALRKAHEGMKQGWFSKRVEKIRSVFQ